MRLRVSKWKWKGAGPCFLGYTPSLRSILVPEIVVLAVVHCKEPNGKELCKTCSRFELSREGGWNLETQKGQAFLNWFFEWKVKEQRKEEEWKMREQKSLYWATVTFTHCMRLDCGYSWVTYPITLLAIFFLVLGVALRHFNPLFLVIDSAVVPFSTIQALSSQALHFSFKHGTFPTRLLWS